MIDKKEVSTTLNKYKDQLNLIDETMEKVNELVDSCEQVIQMSDREQKFIEKGIKIKKIKGIAKAIFPIFFVFSLPLCITFVILSFISLIVSVVSIKWATDYYNDIEGVKNLSKKAIKDKYKYRSYLVEKKRFVLSVIDELTENVHANKKLNENNYNFYESILQEYEKEEKPEIYPNEIKGKLEDIMDFNAE